MERKQDLNHLLWLEKNARRYLAAMTALTLLAVLALSLLNVPPGATGSSAARQDAPLSADGAVLSALDDADAQTNAAPGGAAQPDVSPGNGAASQGAYTPAQITAADAPIAPQAQDAPATEQPTDTAQPAEPSTPAPAPAVETADPLRLSLEGEVRSPCAGALRYGYGVGYDPRCGDYRFHDAVCYDAPGQAAMAVAAGTVQAVEPDAPWQLTLSCGGYQLRYDGLQVVTVAPGDAVTAGMEIGVVAETLRVQAIVAP